MNRLFVLALALVAAAGPASAQSGIRSAVPAGGSTQPVAGQINPDGSVQRGSGFTASRLGPGQYRIRFSAGYFASGCAAMVVEGTSSFNILSNASQARCPERRATFRVNTYDAKSGLLSDQSFAFVAVEE
jgi:hypothetical protein